MSCADVELCRANVSVVEVPEKVSYGKVGTYTFRFSLV